MRQLSSFRRDSRVQQRSRGSAPLRVERLEDRTLPSTTVFEVEPNNTMARANSLPLGFDASEHSNVIVKGSVSAFGDRDWFKVGLNAGDVLGVTVEGRGALDPFVALESGAGMLLIANNDHGQVGTALPPESPLPRIQTANSRDAALYYVIDTTATYFIEVADAANRGSGTYAMELVVARPGLEKAPVGTKQILFLDFDGATIDRSTFEDCLTGAGTATLSPLGSFLAGWGLTAADENAVIDAIVASVRENLSEDIRRFGLNGDYAKNHKPGAFDIEIRNSRDHADEFGTNPYVSRVIIGGTIVEAKSNFASACAEWVDPGNFDTADDAFTLLDQIPRFALNNFTVNPPHTKIGLIGHAVGWHVSHEAGHNFGNFHTERGEYPDVSGQPNIMDNHPFIILSQMVGPDRVFGTSDDVDIDFGVDAYRASEGFVGITDTLNVIAFGLATGKGTGATSPSSSAGSSRSRPGGSHRASFVESNAVTGAGRIPNLAVAVSFAHWIRSSEVSDNAFPSQVGSGLGNTDNTASGSRPRLDVGTVDRYFAAITGESTFCCQQSTLSPRSLADDVLPELLDPDSWQFDEAYSGLLGIHLEGGLTVLCPIQLE